MKIGLLGLVASDWTDVDYNRIRFAAELGFHGVGAHLTVPARAITDELAAHVKAVYNAQNMPFLQVWGPYPCIISPDESIRKAGVEGARDLVGLGRGCRGAHGFLQVRRGRAVCAGSAGTDGIGAVPPRRRSRRRRARSRR